MPTAGGSATLRRTPEGAPEGSAPAGNAGEQRQPNPGGSCTGLARGRDPGEGLARLGHTGCSSAGPARPGPALLAAILRSAARPGAAARRYRRTAAPSALPPEGRLSPIAYRLSLITYRLSLTAPGLSSAPGDGRGERAAREVKAALIKIGF